jgi:hypothetical protein
MDACRIRCAEESHSAGQPVCQRITGEHVDTVVSDVLLQTMTPPALDLALTAQQELQSRLDDADGPSDSQKQDYSGQVAAILAYRFRTRRE